MAPEPPNLTQLLRRGRAGDRLAIDQVMPVVYQELRRLAGSYLRNQNPGHTLQATALVHEAYLRLAERQQPDWQDRAHFFSVAATIMRQILVDHARTRCAAKRGGGAVNVELKDSVMYCDEKAPELVALDDALQALAKLDARQARVLELRYFGGLNNDEIAAVLDIGVATVVRDVRFAEAWLRREMARA